MKGKTSVLILGFGFFTLLFGAGNLLFPPMIGAASGKFWWLSLLGFIASDTLLSFLTLFAFSRHSSLQFFSDNMGERFMQGYRFIIVCLFAFLIIPRTASMSYEFSFQPFLPHINSWIFYILYFMLALFFAFNQNQMLDYLGKLFSPFLILTIFAIIFMGIVNLPTQYTEHTMPSRSFSYGLTSGYQTGDAIGMLFLLSFISSILRPHSHLTKKERGSIMLKAGMICSTLFVLLYCGLAYVGAKVGGNISNIKDPAGILIHIASASLGSYGPPILGITVFLACFTTGLGLLGIVAHCMEEQIFPKTKYRAWIIFFTVVSLIVAHKGIEFIISVAAPLLSVLYPFLITFVILELAKIKDLIVFRTTCYGALIFGFISSLAYFNISWARSVEHLMPLGGLGFAWLVPTLLIFFIIKGLRFLHMKISINNP